MSKEVIHVEGVSKQYVISHHSDRRYDTFRDVILRKARNFYRKNSPDAPEIFQALEDISFSVSQGQRVGIIGRNGAGKSTLLKVLSRITLPSSGRVIIRGRVASMLEVGTGFHPELSGRENIFLNGAIMGMSRAEVRSKLDEIVAFAEVERFLDTPVKRYSTGMYLRLAFAVSAHLDQDILLVDEVLAVGDADFQSRCLGKMDEISREQGRTILFVSHNLDVIRAFCNRTLVISKGRLDFDGTVSGAVARYLSAGKQRICFSRGYEGTKPTIIGASLDPEALSRGSLDLLVRFRSPDALNPPIVGFVVYNANRTPVFGSNPQHHDKGFEPQRLESGTFRARINHIGLHSGTYSLDLWLGNRQEDFDHVQEALVFEYHTQAVYAYTLDPLSSGSVDIPAQWNLEGDPI